MLSIILTTAIAAAAPQVSIDAPIGGWTTERVVTVKGTATSAAQLGTLVVNGVERPLPLGGGRFEATFALARGENAIEVIAPAASGKEEASARLNLYAQIPKVDLQVILFWDTDQTDVDLHITEPSGETVNYSNRSGSSGGRLDRDDTDGYGPEIYNLGAAPAGTYEVAAHYFGDRGTGQSTANVVVVAREGTIDERRWRYEVPLTRAGEKATLAKVNVPPPGIRLEGDKVNLQKDAKHEKDSALPHAGSHGGHDDEH
jgi:uncharacterized protein YfaP (DUF2135 family)